MATKTKKAKKMKKTEAKEEMKKANIRGISESKLEERFEAYSKTSKEFKSLGRILAGKGKRNEVVRNLLKLIVAKEINKEPKEISIKDISSGDYVDKALCSKAAKVLSFLFDKKVNVEAGEKTSKNGYDRLLKSLKVSV